MGMCMFGISGTYGDTELGDYAFCTAACAQHDACNYMDGHFCFDVGLLQVHSVGYCFGATDCPIGNECDPDELCVQTVYGPVCVEQDPNAPTQPLFALGAAAAAGGSSGGAGVGGAGGT